MMKIAMSANGRITIPLRIRKQLNIKKGTRICVVERGRQVVLQPLTEDYFERNDHDKKGSS